MTSPLNRLKQANKKCIFSWIHTLQKPCQAVFRMSKVQIGLKSNKTKSRKRNTLGLKQTNVPLASEIARQPAEIWRTEQKKYRINLHLKGLSHTHRLRLISCLFLLSKADYSANRPLVRFRIFFLFSCVLCSLPIASKFPIHTFDLEVQINSQGVFHSHSGATEVPQRSHSGPLTHIGKLWGL